MNSKFKTGLLAALIFVLLLCVYNFMQIGNLRNELNDAKSRLTTDISSMSSKEDVAMIQRNLDNVNFSLELTGAGDGDMYIDKAKLGIDDNGDFNGIVFLEPSFNYLPRFHEDGTIDFIEEDYYGVVRMIIKKIEEKYENSYKDKFIGKMGKGTIIFVFNDRNVVIYGDDAMKHFENVESFRTK